MTDRERLYEIEARQRLARHYRDQRKMSKEVDNAARDIIVAAGILGAAGVVGAIVILMIIVRWM